MAAVDGVVLGLGGLPSVNSLALYGVSRRHPV
jgi:hypothetical protein